MRDEIYCPKSESSESSEVEEELERKEEKQQQEQQREKQKPEQQQNEEQQQQHANLQPSMQSILVPHATNTTAKRQWNKVQVCIFCGEQKAKIARHLEQMHGEETEVAKIISIELVKSDKKEVRNAKLQERKKMFELLRKRGNFNHNVDVLKEGKGLIIVEKRPSKPQPYTNYLPCEYCLGFYHKKELSKHVKSCSEKPPDVTSKRIQSSASMLLCFDETASPQLTLILSKMLVDDVSRVVKSDKTLLKFGNVMCRKLRKDGDQQHHISSKLRELSRLVLETRKCCSEVESLKDCLNPKNFDFVVDATSELSGWNDDDGSIETPSIGIKLGHSLKKCCKILKGEGIRNGDKYLQRQADQFSELLTLSWNDEISRVARIELSQRKWNKPQLLPLTSDIQKLQKHLKEVAVSATHALKNEKNNLQEWRNLATSLLSTIILFNRRRAGEPALLTIEDFHTKIHQNTTDMNGEIKESLTSFEIQLCQHFKRLEIRGNF